MPETTEHSACRAAYTARDLFDHRLGTFGHAYQAMAYTELYAENEKLRSALDGIRATAGRAWQLNCNPEVYGDIATLAELALASDDKRRECETCAGSGAQLCECDRGERVIYTCFSCSGRECVACGGSGEFRDSEATK
jgi:hypothetical protein